MTGWGQDGIYAQAYADLSDSEVAQYRAEYINETGDKTMGLAAVLRQEGRLEGRQEGKQEGRQEGKVEGEATILLRLLALKFGPLPEEIRDKVRHADADTLLAWSDRILTAVTAAEVVGD